MIDCEVSIEGTSAGHFVAVCTCGWENVWDTGSALYDEVVGVVEDHFLEMQVRATMEPEDTTWVSPDCAVNKHEACAGEALNMSTDDIVACGCHCHGLT